MKAKKGRIKKMETIVVVVVIVVEERRAEVVEEVEAMRGRTKAATMA